MTMGARAGVAMPSNHERIEELRQAAIAKTLEEKFEDACFLLDEALAQAPEEELRELITINKADAMIAMGKNGPEVQALPAILLRRRNLHHTFLAAYALMFKHRISHDIKRSITYGHTALEAAENAGEPFWELSALNDLGIVYEIDSQFEKAIASFERALVLLEHVQDERKKQFSKVAIYQNLGYNKILVGDTQAGIAMVESVLNEIEVPSTRSDSYIDLCYGYLQLDQYEKALELGENGLRLAEEPRQVRNAHYLLGEAAYKVGDFDAADYHFEELGKFYPQFRNLKNVLVALDLRGMLNLRL